MRATRTALSAAPLLASIMRLPPTTIYGLCIRASIEWEWERQNERGREGEGDKHHTIVSQSWIIQACVHGPTHHPFLLMRRWACACFWRIISSFFSNMILYGRGAFRIHILRSIGNFFYFQVSWKISRDSPQGKSFPPKLFRRSPPTTSFQLQFLILAADLTHDDTHCARIQAARYRNSSFVSDFFEKRKKYI